MEQTAAKNQPVVARDLIALLEHQRTLYRTLRVLAARQRSLIVQDEAQPLLALLAQRQQLVDGLVALNARLAPFRKRWPDLYATLDEGTQRTVTELLDEANQSLDAILQSDGEDSASLTIRRAGLAERLVSQESGNRVSMNYTRTERVQGASLTDAVG